LLCALSNTNFFIKILSLIAEYHVDCWVLTNTAVRSAATNFRCHKLIAKANNQKNSDTKYFICNQYGENTPFLSTKSIKICGRITKLETIRMHYACIFFHIDWTSAKIWIFNFLRYCSNLPKVWCAMSYDFVANFIRFPAVQKFWESVKIWQSYR